MDFTSPLLIVAPSTALRLWKHGMRTYKNWRKENDDAMNRYVLYHNEKSLCEFFDKHLDDFEMHKWIIIVDDVGPEFRDAVIKQLKRLSVEAGHRLFMTQVQGEALSYGQHIKQS